jgi:hypothetical protein
MTFNYPNIYTVYEPAGVAVATIGPSLEFPNGFFGYFTADLKLRKMTIIFFESLTYDSWVDFNGPVFTSLTSGANLPQPAYFISYTPANPGILTSTATTIALNLKGVDVMIGDTIVIGW